MTSTRTAFRRGRIAAAAFGIALAFAAPAAAQTPLPPGSTAPAAGSPGAAPSSGDAKAPVTGPKAPPDANQTLPLPEDSGGEAAQSVDVPARQVAITAGSATWESGYAAIRASFAKVRAAVAKANVKEAGRPFAVFVETDDKGFRYDAMIPIANPPADASQLGPDVKTGLSPSGKALKFEHRGAYEEIDSTYEAITAYLDEKGLEAKDMFIEEYLTDTPEADDTSLAVDIYIFIQ